MKKIILILVVLLLAVPAAAEEVFISCAPDTPDSNGWVTISYDASGASELPRAFALNILVTDGAAIVDVNDTINAFYTVNPGTIEIDENGIVTDDGTAVAPGGDPGSCSGDANCRTIEMGSLYVGEINAPPDTGDLLRFQVDGNCEVVITGNAIRGDIVLEDVTVAEVNAPGCEVNDMDCYEGPNPTQWAIQGKPQAWCCPHHPDADLDGSGAVNIMDLMAFKLSYGKLYGVAGYDCRADFDDSGAVNIMDMMKLKLNYGTNFGVPCQDDWKNDCP